MRLLLLPPLPLLLLLLLLLLGQAQEQAQAQMLLLQALLLPLQPLQLQLAAEVSGQALLLLLLLLQAPWQAVPTSSQQGWRQLLQEWAQRCSHPPLRLHLQPQSQSERLRPQTWRLRRPEPGT